MWMVMQRQEIGVNVKKCGTGFKGGDHTRYQGMRMLNHLLPHFSQTLREASAEIDRVEKVSG
jgi:hypothetical protein